MRKICWRDLLALVRQADEECGLAGEMSHVAMEEALAIPGTPPFRPFLQKLVSPLPPLPLTAESTMVTKNPRVAKD